MDKLSERRLAENEVIFKKLNTEAKDFALETGQTEVFGDLNMRFYCECSNMECRERINITPAEYDALHKDRKEFIVLPGHSMPEIETVVKHHKLFDQVRKKITPPEPESIDPKKLLP